MTHSRTIRIGPTEALVAHLVEHLCRVVEAAVALRGVCTLAIPGGSVATAVLPVLAQRQLPWRAVHLFWCDERAVPLADSDSNGGAAMRLIARSPLAEQATWHLMGGDAADLRRAAVDYAAELAVVAGRPPVLDVVLLGVGEDGHVASLFPRHDTDTDTDTDSDSDTEREQTVQLVTNAPKTPPTRLTLSFPVLTAARETIVMAFGSSKSSAVRAALEESDMRSPLARIVRESLTLLLLLDGQAARQLTHTVTHTVTPTGVEHIA